MAHPVPVLGLTVGEDSTDKDDVASQLAKLWLDRYAIRTTGFPGRRVQRQPPRRPRRAGRNTNMHGDPSDEPKKSTAQVASGIRTRRRAATERPKPPAWCGLLMSQSRLNKSAAGPWRVPTAGATPAITSPNALPGTVEAPRLAPMRRRRPHPAQAERIASLPQGKTPTRRVGGPRGQRGHGVHAVRRSNSWKSGKPFRSSSSTHNRNLLSTISGLAMSLRNRKRPMRRGAMS